jgi:hypothetical protein
MDDLRTLEEQLRFPNQLSQADVDVRLAHIYGHCDGLGLSSSIKQIRYIRSPQSAEETPIEKLRQLRRRIHEDLEDQVCFIVNDPSTIRRFFKVQHYEVFDADILIPLGADELFDPSVAARFPACVDDIEQAARCFISNRYTACVFHLMRVVEVAVHKVAKLCGSTDPKASWGANLDRVEKIVLRTKFEDVDPLIKPHRPLLEKLLPEMQAIQRAWRNKVSHVEDKIIPIEARIDEEVANEIMVAVQSFMRDLSKQLPAGI